MRIGYACLTAAVQDMELKSCIMKNATPQRLQALIAHNLAVLNRMLDYNHKNNIRLFRISSEIIPFGSSPANTLDWSGLFREELAALGKKAVEQGMRLSMHPGQYTVLNSPDSGVVERAVEDLRYHTRFLDAMGLGPEHKIILHIGGVYGDKAAAVQRFKDSYKRLDEPIRRRLIIENDDKLYTAQDVLNIALELGVPMVYDNLHHLINPGEGGSDRAWIEAVRATWRAVDGPQKVHYSQQAPGKKPGSHSDSILVEPFMQYLEGATRPDMDIMLEVKDKNLSALRCIHIAQGTSIGRLEAEWGRYKYAVLERDARIYQEIRALLRDKSRVPAQELYALVQQALAQQPSAGGFLNGAQHVWGYFKDKAEEREKRQFAQNIEVFQQGRTGRATIKRQLLRLAKKYGQDYLLDSYYFYYE